MRYIVAILMLACSAHAQLTPREDMRAAIDDWAGRDTTREDYRLEERGGRVYIIGWTLAKRQPVDADLRTPAQIEGAKKPSSVKRALGKLDAIGLLVGLTNAAPRKVLAKVMQQATNAPWAVYRAEAMYAADVVERWRADREAGRVTTDEDAP